jgi:preprotein translocase subunit SecF
VIESLKTYIDGIRLDFVKWFWPCSSVSAVLVVLSWVAFAVVGPNWSIDFTGGTEIHLKFEDPLPIGEVRDAVRSLGLSDDSVQAVNGTESGEFVVRIQDPTFGVEGLADEVKAELERVYGAGWVEQMQTSAEVSARFVVDHGQPAAGHKEVQRAIEATFPQATVSPGRDDDQIVVELPGLAERIEARIATAMGDRAFEVLAIEAIGPRVGADLRRQGFVALVATFALILVYVAFRFDMAFAPGAVIALVHDVSITVGFFVLFQLEFDLTMIGALLTIVGYSINDTIVIYDRIRENREKYSKSATAELLNQSINETLTRTIATNGATMLSIVMFLFFGGPVLRNFALAMMCGILFGTYSTIYIASPMILVMERIKPFLTRLVAIQDAGPDDGGPDPDATGGGPPMTESEKRRRARADAEKREQLG